AEAWHSPPASGCRPACARAPCGCCAGGRGRRRSPVPPAMPRVRRLGDNARMTGPPKPVEIHTDGACLGNPGPGGWAALLRYRGKERELSGGEPHTTNNRMELMAAIMA